jgi:hypothetical protein
MQSKESMETREEYILDMLTGDEELVEVQRYLAIKSHGRQVRLVAANPDMTAMEEMEGAETRTVCS